MSTCLSCGKTLVAIGTERKNGKATHNDWKGRKYHKKCWKELPPASEQDMQKIYDDIKRSDPILSEWYK